MRGLKSFYMTSNSFLKEGIEQPLGDIMALVLTPFLYGVPTIFLLLPLFIAYLERSYPSPFLRWAVAILIVCIDLLLANILAGQSEWWNIFSISKEKHNGKAMSRGLWGLCFILWVIMFFFLLATAGTR